MDMIFHQGGLGFREKGKWWSIVDVERCVISNEKLNELIKEVRSFFRDVDVFEAKQNKGTFRYAVLRTPPNDSSISIVVNESSPRIEEAEEKVKEFAPITSARNLLITYVPPNRDVSVSEKFKVIKGREWLKEEYLGKRFWYPVQGFFQNNHDVAEKMQIYCRSLLQKSEPKDAHLLDLYGGVGTFAVIDSNFFQSATIVEKSPPALEAAERNIQENKASRVTPVSLDSKHLKKIELPRPLFVIADPPRSGIHPKAIKRLKALRPEAIIYVSCNVKQLENDLNVFENYKIKSAALFDLFPQTPHIETLVELNPKK
jgi:tRNA/tmRNA/rRNA uracil-C5-methylase (TrmA/RlmC/RlmD family)